jgi:hypothetical protein
MAAWQPCSPTEPGVALAYGGDAPGAERTLEMAILTAAAQNQAGVRPRDWDSPRIEHGLAITDDTFYQLHAYLAAAAIAFDRGAYDSAGEQTLSPSEMAVLNHRSARPPGR